MNHTARPARTAVGDLRIVVEHWDHLRSLLDSATPEVWPPLRPGAEYLRALDEHDAAEVAAGRHGQQLVTTRHESGQLYYACAHCDRVGEGHEHPVRTDRTAEQLGERPVPLRLHVVDAIRTVELVLTSLADEIAADVQRDVYSPPRWKRPENDPLGREMIAIAAQDDADPKRWRYNMSGRTAPRAAQWLLDRLVGEPGPCMPINDSQRERITRTAREAARRVERTIGSERRSVELSRPCPWCGGVLVMHTGATVETFVSCATGLVDCSAPAPFSVDERRREWSTPEQLAALYVALDAAEQKRLEAERRAKRADDRRRQREAARGNAAA
ncbi:hypothetical protein GTW29_13385 [Streptomyces sp. SID7834]|nr:hypothetical protein [Streptomyces sp. SID7834]MYT57694.1 hypothetical protein [Streptomyces sp. SID7834]